jgi:hypothetical protein
MKGFGYRLAPGSHHMRRVFATQFPRIRLTLMASLLVALVGIMSVVILSLVTGTPVSVFTRDPAHITESSPVIGFLSMLGVMGWAAATAICFMGAGLFSDDRHDQKLTVFLFSSGVLSLVLMLDDALLFHDYLLPNYVHIPQRYTYGAYTLIVAGYLIFFCRQILLTDYLLFMLAFLCLGLSVLFDAFLPFSNLETFVEDGFKFLGIAFWVGYFARVVVLKERT